MPWQQLAPVAMVAPIRGACLVQVYRAPGRIGLGSEANEVPATRWQ